MESHGGFSEHLSSCMEAFSKFQPDCALHTFEFMTLIAVQDTDTEPSIPEARKYSTRNFTQNLHGQWKGYKNNEVYTVQPEDV